MEYKKDDNELKELLENSAEWSDLPEEFKSYQRLVKIISKNSNGEVVGEEYRYIDVDDYNKMFNITK